MGEINCRNCHCAKEEKENDELAIPENANATKVNKPHKEITTYFKTNTLELNSDNGEHGDILLQYVYRVFLS